MGSAGKASVQQIPGKSEFLNGAEKIASGLILLVGSTGSGKTMYCRQFLLDGLHSGDTCIIVSPDVNQLNIPSARHKTSIIPIGLNLRQAESESEAKAQLSSINAAIGKAMRQKKTRGVRIVIDSVTHLCHMWGEKTTTRLLGDLSAILKKGGKGSRIAICTMMPNESQYNAMSAFAEAVIQMKLEEDRKTGQLVRNMRLLSIKGMHHNPAWVDFRITKDGSIVFGDQIASLTCTLCGKDIVDIPPLMDGDFAFDTRKCLELYRKFEGAYGPSMHDTGLPSEAFNVSFFFIDIVGLSDPSLSVSKQIQKIQALNRLISSCDAFKKTIKKIVLPTGDGMAIGFLLNPELPLELGIQLHKKLGAYNADKAKEDRIGVRIGLASGPVFTVTDANNMQNVWGPGIILARRVMDAGDGGHILLEDTIAEELRAIKEEYRAIIRPICNVFKIKHGQKITLYSAYSKDFGNARLPARVPRLRKVKP